MRVLIAEDDGVSRLILKKALKEMGYRVHAVPDGEQAWDAFRKESFPLVISDWVMPGIDGIELCRRIRFHGASGYTYFILLTARDTREDRLHAIEAGADDFLSKPLDRAELASRLSVARRILDMEQRLRDQNRMIQIAYGQFMQLFQNVPVACFTFEPDGSIIEWNKAAEQMYGWKWSEILGSKLSVFDTIIRDEDREAVREMIAKVVLGERVNGAAGVDLCRDGTEKHVMRSLFPLRGADVEPSGGIWASVDITELLNYQRQLESLAYTDALTGLLNHRALHDRLAEVFIAARSGGATFSLAMLDIDHFKRFNDAYGHRAGDEVLRLVAHTLQQNLPPGCSAARYGGEELAVLLPGYSLDSAIAVAERLRQKISEIQNDYRQITASFGVAEYMSYMYSPSELVEVADAALYEAKRAGRNCVRPLRGEELAKPA